MTEQDRNRDMRDTDSSERPSGEQGHGSDWQNPAGTTQQGGHGGMSQGQPGGLGEGQGRSWQGSDEDDLDETERTRQEQGSSTPR